MTFNLLGTLGSFKDPNLPTGYAPFNIQQIGTQVFVTYAVQDAAGMNLVPGSANGIVNVFDQEGNFIRRFASNGPLNVPRGIVQASANFGGFSNDILIGNFGDGTINAFDPTTGNFLGQIKDASGKVIINQDCGLWSSAPMGLGIPTPSISPQVRAAKITACSARFRLSTEELNAQLSARLQVAELPKSAIR